MTKVDSREILLPVLTKDYFKQLGYVNNHQYQIIEDITVYPERVLSGFYPAIGQLRITEETFLGHYYEVSWATKADKKKQKQNWKIMNNVIKSDNI